MKRERLWAVMAIVAIAVIGGVWWLAPETHGQVAAVRAQGSNDHTRQIEVLSGHGSSIGMTIRDIDDADTTKYKLSNQRGVMIEHVDADSPAAKAGILAGDIVVGFDGETVRSARQFARLVEETPAGREVKAVVIRNGAHVELSVTPGSGAIRLGSGRRSDDSWFAGRLRGLPDVPAMPDLSVLDQIPDLKMQLERSLGQSTLGVGVQSMTRDLATYFGAKQGVLVNSVRPDSPAARAGVKAGDVITTVNGEAVDSPSELRRRVRETDATDLTLGIVREKTTISLKATVDTPGRQTTKPRWPV